MELWIDHTWKTVITFVMLLAVTRFLGKEQLSQLTFYDYVVGITLGDIAGFAAVSHENKFLESMYILVLFALCAFAISLLTQISRKARKVIEGQPTMVIYNGKILEQNMHKARYNMDNLITQLRGKGYFRLTDVQFAILETNGELSVMPRPEKKPLTPGDLNLFAPHQDLPVDLIMDGQIIKENLRRHNLSETWLFEYLDRLGYSVQDIMYASIDSAGKIYLDTYEDGLSKDH
ncbi:MAG: DUF421 domain-containing protein [Methylocystaceae bacterium]